MSETGEIPMGVSEAVAAVSKVNFENIEVAANPIDELTEKAKKLGIDVPLGQGLTGPQMDNLYGESAYSEKRKLFGELISNGSTAQVFLDRNTGVLTKVFEMNMPEKQVQKNAEQVEIYRAHAGEDASLTFVGEIPGGWQQRFLENDGDLMKLVVPGQPPLTDGEINRAVGDLEHLTKTIGVAHGDLIKDPSELGDFQREVLRKSFESVVATGNINFQNVLIRNEPDGTRKFLFLDIAGNSDPMPLARTVDTKNSAFIQRERELFRDGLKSIQKKMVETQDREKA